MARLLLAALVFALALAAPVLADTGDPGPPATSFVADDVVITAPATLAVDDASLVGGTVQEVVGVITNLKVVGVGVAIVLTIAALLKLLTKHGAFAALLERTGKTWIRPLLSIATGAVTSLATVLSAGIRDPISLLAAIVAGGLAGAGASGTVDVARATLFPDTRTKHSADADALGIAAAALEQQIVASAKTTSAAAIARTRVTDAATLAPGKRLESLAQLLRASP